MNLRRAFFSVLAICVVAFPLIALAQGLVPCGDGGREACQFCHVAQLLNNVLAWLVGFLTVVAAILFAVAGLRLVSSAGNQSAKENAKSIITNTIVGYLIVLSAWLGIDFLMKSLLGEGPAQLGVWNTIECVEQPSLARHDFEWEVPGRITASGANQTLYSPTDVTTAVNNIQNAGGVRSMAEQAAVEAGLSGQDVATFVSLVQQESSMCANKVGPQTRYGRAYGCSQMLLSTAQGLDSSATADRLRDDDAYSLALGARYFASRVQLYDGDVRRALAAYNGGTKANAQSDVCPGQLVWECEQNDGYRETRNYVSNILSMTEVLEP